MSVVILNRLGADNFNQANGPLSSNWTTGYLIGTVPAIVGNRVRGASTNSQNMASYNAVVPGVHQFARLTIPTLTESAGNINAAVVQLRMNASGNPSCYTFNAIPAAAVTGTPGNSHIGRWNGDGTGTTLTFEDVVPWASGDSIWGLSVGPRHSLWRTPLGTGLDFSLATKILEIEDSTWTSGRAGFSTFTVAALTVADCELDDFVFGEVVPSPFTLIASVSARSANNTSVTTGSINTTGASLLIATCSGTTNAFNPTDLFGNVWTPLTLADRGAGNRARIFYVQNPIVGSGHTFADNPGGGSPVLCVLAFSGSRAVSVLEGQSGTAIDSGTIQPGSIASNGPYRLFVTGLGHGGTSAPTISTGYTVQESQLPSATSWGGAAAYKIQVDGSAENPLWTRQGSDFGAGMATVMAAFVPIAHYQSAYRFRDDDGSEAAASWLAAENVNIIRAKNTNTRLRVQLDVEEALSNESLRLEYRLKGSGGAWRTVEPL